MNAKTSIRCALALALLPAATAADGLEPGSVLIFPLHRSGNAPAVMTIVAVTNLNLMPVTPANGLGGSTNLHYEFVNVNQATFAGQNTCQVSDTIQMLTPADTRVSNTRCDNPGSNEGYLVVSALDPNTFDSPWSHNHLIGTEMAIGFDGGLRFINAVPFRSMQEAGMPTDLDGDDELDFDGVEYEGVPDELYIDFFASDVTPAVMLINLSGGLAFTANVRFDVFNDNEQGMSATHSFRCWTAPWLRDISLVFDPSFLRLNTLNDPRELDLDCRTGTGDEVEAGWARIRGLNHSSVAGSCPDAALLGMLDNGPEILAGGHRLWESKAVQLDGDFFKTGTTDPECGD